MTTSYVGADGQGRQTITSDRVLLAVGVRANVEGIGLEGMGVTLDRGFIQVDDQYRTTAPGIWAIGDCAGPPALAHVATAEAVRTRRDHGRQATSSRSTTTPSRAAPTATPRSPRSARPRRRRARRGSTSTWASSPSTSTARRVGAGHLDGFIKVIVNKGDHDRVVGVHSIGYGVTDLIAEMSTAMTSEATAHESWPPSTRTRRCPR